MDDTLYAPIERRGVAGLGMWDRMGARIQNIYIRHPTTPARGYWLSSLSVQEAYIQVLEPPSSLAQQNMEEDPLDRLNRLYRQSHETSQMLQGLLSEHSGFYFNTKTWQSDLLVYDPETTPAGQITYPRTSRGLLYQDGFSCINFKKMLDRLIKWQVYRYDPDSHAKGWVYEKAASQIASAWASLTSQSQYTFEEIRGPDIATAYREGPESCMSTVKKERLALYTENPERISLIKIYKYGDYMGRALAFLTDQGRKALSRIYPTDGGSHISALLAWAKAQGWDCPYHDDVDYSGQVTLTPATSYPYLDYFIHARRYKGFLILSPLSDKGTRDLQHTDAKGWCATCDVFREVDIQTGVCFECEDEYRDEEED